MAEENRTRTLVIGAAVIGLVVVGGLVVDDPGIREGALRSALLLAAAGEAVGGGMQVLAARRMSAYTGRPYAPAYHGTVQDFGFYNLAMALLLARAAMDAAARSAILPAVVALYGVHGGTHLLRFFGLYYGGDAAVPTRSRDLELRDALPLLAALAAFVAFRPS